MFVKFNVFDARLILETVKSHKTTNQSLSGCFITYWQYKEKKLLRKSDTMIDNGRNLDII